MLIHNSQSSNISQSIPEIIPTFYSNRTAVSVVDSNSLYHVAKVLLHAVLQSLFITSEFTILLIEINRHITDQTVSGAYVFSIFDVYCKNFKISTKLSCYR